MNDYQVMRVRRLRVVNDSQYVGFRRFKLVNDYQVMRVRRSRVVNDYQYVGFRRFRLVNDVKKSKKSKFIKNSKK